MVRTEKTFCLSLHLNQLSTSGFYSNFENPTTGVICNVLDQTAGHRLFSNNAQTYVDYPD